MGKQIGITFPQDNDASNTPLVEYSDDEPMSADQVAETMVVLMRDTMGDNPELSDLLAIQAAMGRALNPQRA